MKKRLIITLILIFISIGLYAQNQSYAMIYVYRPKSFSLDTKFPIIFNNREVHKLPRHAKFAYKIYSEGYLDMAFFGRVNINIKVEHGKVYYIKSPNNGVSKLVDEETGKNEFNDTKLYPNGYVQKEEDTNDPIIPVAFQLAKDGSQDKENKNPKLLAASTLSDVDINIPLVAKENPYRFALIIGNEDYSSQQKEMGNEINVDFARNDAKAFKNYATSVMGVPEINITLLLDATAASMWQSIDKLNKLIKATNGKAEILFFYAGHGLPDEVTKEPYLIPVDVSGANLTYAIKLAAVYAKLTEFPSQRVTAFIDACFSGGARNQALLAARGVKVKPKDNILNGNLVVFTASSDEQSSLPYKEKQHGLFTYCLLKKIQESKGEITYNQLSDFLKEQVGLSSILVNSKEQNPQTLISPSLQNSWESWVVK